MSVLKEELVGLLKSGTTGMSSDADAVRLEKRAGVNSLNDLRGAIEALNEAREQTLKGLHAEIRGRGGDPSRYTYADPVANKPTTSAEDVAFGESLKETPLARMPSQLIEEGKPGAGSPYSIDLAARAEYKETGITKGQRKAVQDSVQIANDPTKSRSQRDAALSRLSVGAESAQSPGLRDLYQAALMSAQTSAIRPAPEEL
jgi:hypothetical protein